MRGLLHLCSCMLLLVISGYSYGAEIPEYACLKTAGKIAIDGRHFVDAIMMNDSFFKVFLDPDGDGKKYMEFHINPR